MNIVKPNYGRLFPATLAVFVMVFLAGCAAHHAYLVPAPTHNLANGGQAAMASAENVSITVTPNAWQGRPYDLYKWVTPLKVRIENHGKQPLRLVYRDFNLESPGGNLLAALPPSEIRTQDVGENRPPQAPHLTDAAWRGPDRDHDVDKGPVVVVSPDFDWDDFYYAPYWGYG